VLEVSTAETDGGRPMETTPEKPTEEAFEMADNGLGLMLIVLLALTIVAALAM